MAGLLDARVVVHNDGCRGIILRLGREEIPRKGIRPQARPPDYASSADHAGAVCRS